MSRLKSDCSGNSNESVGSYSFIRDHKPRNGNCSGPDSVADTTWWLNHSGLETETYGDSKFIKGYCNPDPKTDHSDPLKHLFSHCKSNGDSCLLGYESAIDNSDLLPNSQLAGLDSWNRVLFEQPDKLYSDLDSNWIGVKKIEPWWHAADKDEITASLTSQSSSHHNKSCYHPGVQSRHVEKVTDNSNCFNQYEENLMDKETKSPGKQGLTESLLQQSDQRCSKDCNNAAEVDSSDTRVLNGNLNRAQLLEALCHSQTRAREAEKLAQEACDEKDHVIDLFFQQASCLFAYRQWIRMLQLETLCLQLRSKDGISSFGPQTLFPGVRSKDVNLRENRSGDAKRKADKHRFNAGKRALASAIGLGLAGAGLLVGWTIGWLLTAF